MRFILSRAHFPVVIGAVALVLTTACGDDEASPVELEGKSYVATDIDGHTIVDGSEVAISFADGSISIEAGCNTQNGAYELTDGVLEVEMLMSTMMACDEPLMAQDQLVASIVTSGPTVEADGDDIVLESPAGSMTLTEQG